MRNNHDSNRSVNGQHEDLNSAFCWGAEAIGAVIGRNPRQTHHLLTRGEIKSATFAPSRSPTGVKAVYRTRTRRTRWIVVRQRRRASRSIPVYVRSEEDF
jgi:hypothetical protein